MLNICWRRTALFCNFFLFYHLVHSQDIEQNKLDSFSGKLITSIRARATPKAFLTIDKTVFKAGETIWFNAFLLNGVSQKVTAWSKYLFVDLVNKNDDVFMSVLLEPSIRQSNGKIVLPGNLPAGYYWLRAYTRQMAENNPNGSAVKSIYVFNSLTGPDKIAVSKPMPSKPEDIPVINFYPEGGAIITGANSTVAFTTRDKYERAITIEGLVKDNMDAVITRFNSDESGLGKFSFSPSRYRQYKAYITWNGKEINYALPAFNFKAAQLSVSAQANGTRLVRVLLEDSIYSKDAVTYVIGISKDSLCFAGIGRGQYEIAVPDQKFPAGIATFYLFDSNLKLLSERSMYVRDHNVIIKAALDKNSFTKKSKVTLTISITDNNQQPIPSLYSVAVTDSMFGDRMDGCLVAALTETNKQEIINNMALARMECLTNDELDVIMLLRNSTYYSSVSNVAASPPMVDTDSLLHISGRVLNEKKEAAANKIVALFSKSGNGVYETDTTDERGRFHFPVEGYGDSTQFSINVKSISGRSEAAVIIPDTLDMPVFKTPASLKQTYVAATVIARYRRAYLDQDIALSDRERLPAVTLVSRKVVNYNVLKRVSQSSAIVTADDVAEGMSIGNAILGIGGLHLLNGFLVINGLTQLAAPNAGSEPMILVDGVQAGLSPDLGNASPAMSYLNSLNIKDVDFIEVIKGSDGAAYGVRGGNGVVLINMATNRKDQYKTGNNNGTIFYARGIANPAYFPILNYDKKAINATDFDNRSTIFWNGSVLSGAEKNTTFSFYTSDVAATYKVTISGVTTHGDVVFKTLTFNSD